MRTPCRAQNRSQPGAHGPECRRQPGAAQFPDHLTRPSHVSPFRIVPRKLKGKIGLHRNAQVGRPVGIVVPTARGHLLREQITGGLGHALVALAAQEGHEQDVLGLQDGVALKFADPVAIRGLSIKKAAPGSLQRSQEKRFVTLTMVGTIGRQATEAWQNGG